MWPAGGAEPPVLSVRCHQPFKVEGMEDGYFGWGPKNGAAEQLLINESGPSPGLKDSQAESQEPGTVPRTPG